MKCVVKTEITLSFINISILGNYIEAVASWAGPWAIEKIEILPITITKEEWEEKQKALDKWADEWKEEQKMVGNEKD